MESKIITFKNEKDEIEYDFVALDNWDDFDRIMQYLITHEEATVIDVLDGIYSRIGHLQKDGIEFKLLFHEDVGNYFILVKQDDEQNRVLFEIAQRAIDSISPRPPAP